MSPRNKQANLEILDKRREQILNTALKIFAHKGYAATKISDIAITAKLSQGLIYHYFRTKDDIFTELVKQTFSILKMPEHFNNSGDTPLNKIKKIAEMIITTVFEGGALYYWHIINQAYISEAIPKQAKAHINKNKTALSDSIIPIIIEGQKLGQITKDDPLALYTAFYSVLNGIAMQLMRARNTPDYPVSVPGVDIVMRLLKNPDIEKNNNP